MAQKIYVGAGNVAKNVNKMYVGVNNVAKKVLKAYVGVNGVAKQFFESYTILNWIKGNGTSTYIDSGIKGDGNTDFEIYFECDLSTSISQGLLGGLSSGPSKRFQAFYNPSQSSGYIAYNDTANKLTESLVTGTNYTFKKDNNNLYLNTTLVTTITQATFETDNNLPIFATNNNGTIQNFAKAKLYYLKIWKNGVLVRDFIPAMRDSDSHIGLLDKVENKFYENLGTGSFTYG